VTPRVPRTLHLTVREGGGGTETNVRRLCDAIPEFTHLSIESLIGFPIRTLALPRVVSELRRRDPEVLFCYGATAHLVALMAYPWGRPLVGNIRSTYDFHGVKNLLFRLIRPRFSPWISNSRAALDLLPMAGSPSIVIYNGVPDPPAGEEPLFRDLPRPVLGILGRGDNRKGHRFLKRLWLDLGKPGTLVFAGDLPESLKTAAERDGVLCPGYVDAGRLLRSLDLLCVPSSAEGIPTVLPEAMIRGVPCLATPVGGIPEIITHGHNGFLLPRQGWRRFLRESDGEGWKAVGEAGRLYAREHCSLERMKAGFIDAACRAAGREARSGSPA
jgi:glycosyltransferase involved in cell wall biosynthesis